MKIPQGLKGHALREFEFVLLKLKEKIPLDERLYYYSALFGEVYRIMNIECSRDLIFLHHALNTVHTAFQTRLQAITRGAERPIMIDDKMIEVLISLTNALSERIRDDKDSTDICIDLLTLAYATTGNGFYLYQKGELELLQSS
jgi:hypothetical protein